MLVTGEVTPSRRIYRAPKRPTAAPVVPDTDAFEVVVRESAGNANRGDELTLSGAVGKASVAAIFGYGIPCIVFADLDGAQETVPTPLRVEKSQVSQKVWEIPYASSCKGR